MNYEVGQLQKLLRSARRRRRLMIVLRGAAVCLGVGACVLLLTGWGAYRYRQSEGALLALRVGALAALLAAVYVALVRPLARRIGDARLARFIEERARGTEDRLVTAVEFGEGEEARRVSRALLERLRSDADGAAAGVDLDRVFGRRALAVYGAAALASLLLFAGVLKWGPRGVSEGVAQLVAPAGLAAEADARAIKVKPGTTRVPKGSDQEIKAALAGFDAEAASLFTRAAGAGEDGWQGQAMEQAKVRGEFELSLLNMQESAEYFVESEGVRSEVFKLEVVDLPFVKQLDLVLNFPAFSHLPAKAVEDGGDVAALKGTVVNVTARLSGKARAARLVFADGRRAEMKAAGQDFVGALTVTGDTSYFVELTSVDGEVYRGSNEYDVTALEDMPPTISFERPGRDAKATNLEEVFTQARAEDDFGVASIELFFSVNGGEEQRVGLQDLSRDAARSLTGTHTFFMEEYKLKPGDFISYYAKARDASNETTSDIYFIEVKPFEMQYKQSQAQQGQSGGGQGEGADQNQNALTRRQKELIAATHRLMREGQRYTPQERGDGYEAVAAGQEKLKADTLEFLERVRRRMGEQLEGREELSRMAEDLRAAAREMEGAPPPLRKQAGRDALPPEQRALQRLLAADAVFREMQVAFGNQQGGGGGGERESRELTDLMELELDKMKNQYETLNREQRQRAEQAKSEAERRLEELARRQERALEEQRRRQQGQPQNGGGGGGSQRQQQEMVDEARKAARELERLSRERRDARMQELSRQLDQAADDLQRAQSSSKSNPNDAIAQGERALERMQQAQRRMQQMRGGGASGQQSRAQEIGDLRQRAAEAAARQRELAREAESLARRGSQQGQQGEESARAARERLAERGQALADSVNNLEEETRQKARSLGEGKQSAAARRLNEAADALRRNRVAERIREGARGAEQGRPESVREAGRAAAQGLGEMSERLQEAEAAAGRPSSGGAEEALDRTRQLADDLDSLRRRLEDRAARREGRGQQSQRGQQQSQGGQQQGGRQQGGQRGQEGRQQSAQQSQSGQQGQGGQQGSRSQQQTGQQSAQQSGQQTGGGGGSRGGGDMIAGTGADDARQLGSELRERLRDAENLRRELGGTSGRELGGAIEQLRGMADGRMEGEALTAASLKAQVIDPLRQLELELSKRLREQLGRTNLRLGDEGAAPGRYRKSVEEYYRRLSQGGRQ